MPSSAVKGPLLPAHSRGGRAPPSPESGRKGRAGTPNSNRNRMTRRAPLSASSDWMTATVARTRALSPAAPSQKKSKRLFDERRCHCHCEFALVVIVIGSSEGCRSNLHIVHEAVGNRPVERSKDQARIRFLFMPTRRSDRYSRAWCSISRIRSSATSKLESRVVVTSDNIL